MSFFERVLDRTISAISPRAGLARKRDRAFLTALSGHEGGRRGNRRFSGFNPLAGSADTDNLKDLPTLRARSRDLVRNNALARSTIDTNAVNVVGTGHVVIPEINAERLGLSPEAKEAWERTAGEIWDEWASETSCDAADAQTFPEMEDLVDRSRTTSGDVFLVRRFIEGRGPLATAYQVIEADLCSNPDRVTDTAELAGGINRDPFGAAIAYNFADRYEFDLVNRGATTWTRVPARGSDGRRLVLHCHTTRDRPDITRYVPMLATAIAPLKHLSDYSEAELMAAVINSCVAIGMKSPDSGNTPLQNGLASEGGEFKRKVADDVKLIEPGMVYDIADNEEIFSFSPSRPSTAFAGFMDAITREIGAAVDMPHELILKNFQASYSASRAALEIAWQSFRTKRRHHVLQMVRPIYRDVITEAVARRMLPAPGFFEDPMIRAAWLGASFIGPARPSIDPVKDATADEKYLAMRVTTRAKIIAERFGQNWEFVFAQSEREDERLGSPGPAAEPAAPAAPDGSDRED